MLKLKKISSTIKETIEFDFYIPLKINFGYVDASMDGNLYWRTGNLKQTLIEIGFGKVYGTIRSITLICKPKVQIKNDYQNNDAIIKKFGLPEFKTGKWKKSFYSRDEIGDFFMSINDTNLIITFSQHPIKFKVINNRIVFSFNRNKKLCSIEIQNLNIDELAILKDYLNVYEI